MFRGASLPRSLLSRARALHRCARLVKGGRLSLYFRAWALNIRRRSRGGRLPPDPTRHDALRALYTITYVRRWVQRGEMMNLTILRKCLGRFAHRAVGRAAAKWWGDVSGKTTGRPSRAPQSYLARVGDECHLAVEVHGADYRKVERGPATVTKEAGRRAAIIEAGSRRTDDQGRRKSTAARVVQMAGPDAVIKCLGTKALPISDV